MRNLENAPRIYVGTYGQYNSWSLFRKWSDLTGYADLKEFLQDCHELHRNEFDSELMFQCKYPDSSLLIVLLAKIHFSNSGYNSSRIAKIIWGVTTTGHRPNHVENISKSTRTKRHMLSETRRRSQNRSAQYFLLLISPHNR